MFSVLFMNAVLSCSLVVAYAQGINNEYVYA